MLLADFLQMFCERLNSSIAFALVACRNYQDEVLALGPGLEKFIDETRADSES